MNIKLFNTEHCVKFHVADITKVPVFYCLMKKFKSLNFYQKYFFTFFTILDRTHQDLLKITTKNDFCLLNDFMDFMTHLPQI